MHRHGVGLSAEAIVLTTVAVSQRVPTMTVTAAGVVVVRATEQRTPTASRTQDASLKSRSSPLAEAGGGS
jgi:hypothetical protein